MTLDAQRIQDEATWRVAGGPGAAGLGVKKTSEVPAVLAQAREIARSGRPMLVNVWLDRTDFREGSLSM